MLLVLFHLGKERYALEATRVVEIVPLVALKKFPHPPKGVAGMFIYRGQPVPALDLCELTMGRPAVEHLSTRIIIINSSETPGEEQLIGLIAERATEIMRRDHKDFIQTGVELPTVPFLGPVLMDATGVIQLISTDKLVRESVRTLLSASPTEAGHATH